MSNVRRYDPFGEMLSLRDAMSQLFEDSFVSPAAVGGRDAFSMPLDVSETQDSFIIDAVLPGLKAEDIDITIQDKVLTIRGETRKEQSSEKQANYHVMERRYGRFTRSVSLPTSVNGDAVRATLENGILHLEVPKADEVKPRKIAVNPQRTLQSEPVNVSANGEHSHARGQ